MTQDDNASKRRKHMAVMDDKRDLIPRAEADAMVVAALRMAADKVSANRAELNYRAMLQLLRDQPLPEEIVIATSKLLDGISSAILSLTPAITEAGQ